MSAGSASLIAMPERWSADSVLALAPDDSSRRSSAGLGRPGPWRSTGTAGEVVWGLCAGSGKSPYQTVVDLSGPAYKCSCPSRKFPCKHALGLLLNWANGNVPEGGEAADFARAWLDDRRSRAEKAAKPSARTVPADSRSPRDPSDVKDEAAAARRAQQRAQRVSNGLTELESWLRDQVHVGLSATQVGGPGHANEIAARMVDAQAPGVAAVLRGLSTVPSSGEGWPGRLLAEYAQLHLLVRAHQRLDTLPADLAATVRSRVGYPTGRQEVLTGPAVTDHWAVLGVRDLADGPVPGRRVWLRGRDSGQWAMLLTFGGPGGWQDHDTARLRPGTELHASLHFYPGQPPMRAVMGARHVQPVPAERPVPAGDIDALLAGYAAGIEQDPWLTVWPALLVGTVVAPGNGAAAGGGWLLIDKTGAALLLAARESLWTLLAVSGGDPVAVAGEWHPDGLLALTAWHRDRAVTL
jgi:SWIM zinc finger